MNTTVSVAETIYKFITTFSVLLYYYTL